MMAAVVALVFHVAYLLVVFGFRAWLMRRRTGTTGWRGLTGETGSVPWFGGVLFAAALVAGLAAPALQIVGLVRPMLDSPAQHAFGVATVVLGCIATLSGQHAMGVNWRVGVDDEERTELVQSGPFALVRNPFFTALLMTASGLCLLVPNPIAIAALAVLVVAVQVQVRAVEEPHLLATHGAEYLDYARRIGRFVPGVGTIDSSSRPLCRRV